MPGSLRQPLKDHAVVCRFDVEAISLWYNHYTVIRSSVQTFSGHRPDVFGCQKTPRSPIAMSRSTSNSRSVKGSIKRWSALKEDTLVVGAATSAGLLPEIDLLEPLEQFRKQVPARAATPPQRAAGRVQSPALPADV